MKRKEQYADEIIEMLERTKRGAWASNINLNTKDRVIEVCQNCVDSWSGRKFKDHCTTPPQALEQTRWIPVSERLPEMYEEIGILKKYVSMRSDEVIVTIRDNKNGSVVTHSECYLWDGKWHGDIFDWLKASKVDYDVIAWQPLPKPYEPQESEVQDADSD